MAAGSEIAIDMLEVDLTSPAGIDLMHRTAELHGAGLAGAARVAARLFLLRSALAPGLRFVGGVARPPAGGAAAVTGTFSLSGAGETLEDAVAACLGEGIERTGQIERPGDVARTASIEEAAPHLLAATSARIAEVQAEAGARSDAAVAWVRASCLVSGRDTLVPADWCLRRSPEGGLRVPGQALSTGAAAGRDAGAATLGALLELVERDAAALWWLGGRRGRPLAADGPAMAAAVATLGHLRQGARLRATWLLDITTDLGVPVIAALSTNAEGRSFACGVAARLDPTAAARKAVLELCQMELANVLAAAKRRRQGEAAALADSEQRLLARDDMLDVGSCELLRPLGAPAVETGMADLAGSASADDLARLIGVFQARGIEAAVVSLDRREHDIALVVAVAPALQAMPSGCPTRRLRQVIEATGGGQRWTRGAPLM